MQRPACSCWRDRRRSPRRSPSAPSSSSSSSPTPTALERYTDIAQAAVDGGATSRRLRPRAGGDGRHGHPAGHRRRLPGSSRTSVRDIFAGVGRAAGRDPRGGARSRQRGHDHPGRRCRGGRRRHLHRPHRRPYNPKVVRATTGRSSTCRSRWAATRRARSTPSRRRAAGARRRRQGRRSARSRATGALAEPTAGCSATRRAASRTSTLALADRAVSRADLRPRRVDEPGDRGVRVPLRDRIRPARLRPLWKRSAESRTSRAVYAGNQCRLTL